MVAEPAPFELVSERRWTVPEVLTIESPHRLEFGWTWASGPTVLYIGVNPSFGTADTPDATMFKWRGIAAFNGCGSYLAGNPFTRRESDPRTLGRRYDPDAQDWAIHPKNEDHLVELMRRSDMIVACWGNLPNHVLIRQVSHVHLMLERSGKPLFCLGRTRQGMPKHPLFLPTKTRFVRFD